MRKGVAFVAAFLLGAAAASAYSAAAGRGGGQTFRSPTGALLKVLVDEKVLGGTEVEIAELTLPPNGDSGDHRHGVTETFYLLEGALEQVINGTPLPLAPGQSASIRASDQVRHKAGPDGARILVVWAPGGEIARVTARWNAQ